MRLSTNILFSQGSRALLDQQSRMAGIAEQLGSGKRVNKPSDDPRAAANLLVREHGNRVEQQYADNRAAARNRLATEEGQLNRITDVLEQAKQVLIYARNDTLNDNDRTILGTQLENIYQQTLAAANARDSDGNYIFAGFQTDTQPFSESVPGQPDSMTYYGDSNRARLQVGSTRQITAGTPGSAVFGADAPDDNILNTLAKAVQALKTGTDVAVTVDHAQQQVEQSFGNVLLVRSELGTQMKELDQLDDAGVVQAISNEEQISHLRDADLARVIPDFLMAQTALQAAQKSFLSVQHMSLFSMG